MKRLTLLLPLVLLIAIFAGCGGGDDDNSADTGTTGSANPDKEYLVSTDQFCGEANAQLQKKAAGAFPDGKPSKKNAVAFVKSQIVPNYGSQIGAMKALDAPGDQQEDLDKVISTFQQAIDKLDKDPASIFKGNALADSTKVATDFGFANCATGGTDVKVGTGSATAG